MTYSDSDSDDDFLQQSAAFSKTPSRQEQKKHKADSDFLDQFVASGEAFCSKKAKLGEIGAYKESSLDSLSLSEQVQSMSKSNSHEQKKILKGLTGLYKDDFLPEHVLRARISSIQACRRERYGERHVIQYDPKRAINPLMRFFRSTDEAVAALQQTVMEKLQQQDATGTDPCDAPLRRLNVAVQGKAAPVQLTVFVESGRLGELIESNVGHMSGLEDICSWLFCSTLSFHPNERLAMASKQALTQLLQLGRAPDGCWFKSWESLLDLLQVWIDMDVCAQEENKENDGSPIACNNITGLANLLSLWDEAIAHHGPSLDLSKETATALVVVLLRLALDGQTADQLGCIRRLLVAVTDRIQAGHPDAFALWACETANAVLTGISSVGKMPAEVDYEDCEGYLVCALTAELLPATGPLKVALLNRSLEICLAIPNWRNYVMLTMPDFKKKEKITEHASEEPWWCLLSSVAALDTLCDESDESDKSIQRDRVRFQAIFLLALAAFDTAMVGWSQPTAGAKVIQEYGRQTQAALVADVLGRMELSAETIKRLTKKNIQDSLWRRTNYLCSSFQNYLSHAVRWACDQGGVTHKTKVQTSMKDHMKVV